MEEMMREWMTRQMEANERMKDQVVELENRINQGLRNRQVIIKNLERQFKIAPYTNAKTFADDVLLYNAGDKELKSIDGVGTERMTKMEKDDNGMLKEPNKEWKLNEKVVPHNKDMYHCIWPPWKFPT
ncbi:hypothetical protein Tco_1069601 [Tanacetum coccineum]|uniref:Uncharacterized protein n=1 Tax=Tanacetum coccineum TaxID=301880 RepID=A0ABQ5HKF5_9ASTR